LQLPGQDNMLATRSSVRCARAAASPWGAEAWRHDKTAFAQWCTDASKNPNSKAKRELYGFLTMAFGDVDVDKDGKINAQEFDFLCEKVASMPRRFGLAPSWQAEYGGSVDKRTAARKAMFDAIDAKAGTSRGWIGCAQFVDWAFTHVAGKAGTIGASEVDLYHVQNYTEGDLLKTLEVACSDKNSREYAGLYEFLLTLFVEVDEGCKGEISFNEFNGLIERAALVPRTFGLAPPDGTHEERKAIFASMDDTKTGLITFRKFLEWVVSHTAGKVAAQKAGKGYKK
jgi:hypothetical protein